jgi:GNAT superfamily N-acetyltransferase
VTGVVPALVAAFGPDVIVSQHGSDGHVWDPLAHLSLTTTAMGEAARLVDRLAHRHAGGRWLATGGGGYAIYRVVPRAWALTWLAGAHREAPRLLPEVWRERWSGEAARWGDGPLPLGFEDEPGLGEPGIGEPGIGEPGIPSERSLGQAVAPATGRTVRLVRALTIPALLRLAEERGWWKPEDSSASPAPSRRTRVATGAQGRSTVGRPTVVAPLTLEMLDRLSLAERSIAPADPHAGRALLRHALADGAVAVGAVSGEWLVGVALAAPSAVEGIDQLAALGVGPEWRRLGLATALLQSLCERQDGRGRGLVEIHTAAERDPFDPLPREVRRSVADTLFRVAGLRPVSVARLAAADPGSFAAVHLPPGHPSGLLASVQRWLDSL